jgi:hypothetical protein
MLNSIVIKQDLFVQIHTAFRAHVQLMKSLILYLHEIKRFPGFPTFRSAHFQSMLPLLDIKQSLFFLLIYKLLLKRALADDIPEVKLEVLLELLWDYLDYATVLPLWREVFKHTSIIILIYSTSSATLSWFTSS